MWPEVLIAKKEKRRELILNGCTISERLQKEKVLDSGIFALTNLNYLNISNTCLESIPDGILQLVHLQSLVLHSNQIRELNAKHVSSLQVLKTLDLSNNQLKVIPKEVGQLPKLQVLNLSKNALVRLPCFEKCINLASINVSGNEIENFPDVCYVTLIHLSEILADQNAIKTIPAQILVLAPSLKIVSLRNNKLSDVPEVMTQIPKLKEFNIVANPLSDKRFLKVVEKNQLKLILDFLKKKQKENIEAVPQTNSSPVEVDPLNGATDKKFLVHICPYTQDLVVRVQTELVKTVRQHILCCIMENLKWTKESLKKFIQMQTRLHNEPSLCDRRNSATIATHDLQKIAKVPEAHETVIKYTAKLPQVLKIVPLGRASTFSGAELYAKLKVEADQFRKEKKRNTISGVHKYLHLIKGARFYPCLLDGADNVISMPPITNSDSTKITIDTVNVFVEVTSSESLTKCRQVIEALIKETVTILDADDNELTDKKLVVRQVRITDNENHLKAIYPSKNDLEAPGDEYFSIVRDIRGD